MKIFLSDKIITNFKNFLKRHKNRSVKPLIPAETQYKTPVRITIYNSAFTLAEVLITLAIIGVVAAMTIPAVLNHTKETQMKTGLKKAQSVLSEALQLMIYETGIIPNPTNYPCNTNSGTNFKDIFQNYIFVTNDCKKVGCATNAYQNEGSSTNYSDIYKSYDGKKDVDNHYFDDGQIQLADGMFLMIENCSSAIFLSVDINGIHNKPNKWGHDLFTFQIDNQTGELKPMGANDTLLKSYCSKTSSDSINGVSCTYSALTDKDYFKNLP